MASVFQFLVRVLALLVSSFVVLSGAAAEESNATPGGWRELNYLPYSIKVPMGMNKSGPKLVESRYARGNTFEWGFLESR